VALIGRFIAYRWLCRFGILFSQNELLGILEAFYSKEMTQI
jgi:hypothetical protein